MHLLDRADELAQPARRVARLPGVRGAALVADGAGAVVVLAAVPLAGPGRRGAGAAGGMTCDWRVAMIMGAAIGALLVLSIVWVWLWVDHSWPR